MRAFVLPACLAALAHLGVLGGNLGYQPVAYDVVAAPQSVHLILAAPAPVPAAEHKPAPVPIADPVEIPEEQSGPMEEMEEITQAMPQENEEAPEAQEDMVGALAAPLPGEANRPPRYPRRAVRMGWEGTVLLEVHVDARGIAMDVAVKQSSTHDLLDAAAMQAVRQWVFRPAKRFGVAVQSTVQVPVVFEIKR